MPDRHAFGDTSRRLGPALDTLGLAWRGTGQEAFDASPLQAALVPTLSRKPVWHPGEP